MNFWQTLLLIIVVIGIEKIWNWENRTPKEEQKKRTEELGSKAGEWIAQNIIYGIWIRYRWVIYQFNKLFNRQSK